MLFKETIQMAISALWANKMRSLLTMLGIIIGVGAVIAMVSIGMGVRKQVEDSIASLGSNMLIVNASATKNAAGVRQAAGSNVRSYKKENKRCRICFTTGTKKLSNRKW